MDIEQVREYALGIDEAVTEELFAEDWIIFRIGGKWFLLVPLDAAEPRVAVKLPPDEGEALRDRYSGITAAYHMNKRHWNDLYIEQLDDALVRELILRSYELVFEKLPKNVRLTIRPTDKQ